MPGRRCPVPGCPVVLVHGERYCTEHTRTYEQRRGTREQRGYAKAHKRLRATWQARIDQGDVVRCPTCGARITPDTPWQLGHTPDRHAYLGPQCIPCNTGDGGRRGAAMTNATRDPSHDHFLT